MRLLILGGTGFLGRHLVEAALASSADVTLFTRGRTAPDLFPNLARITGDRDGDLAGLEPGQWDAVIDTSGYVPRVVRQSAQLLARRVAHYTFISSAAVYDPSAAPPLSEASPTLSLADESSEDISRDYGALKRACERVLEVELPGRALLVRAGILAGAWDPTDRFTYWIRRLARGGDVLAPAPPEALTQCIDVRDLARWVVHAVQRGLTGPYNVAAPAIAFGDLLDRAAMAIAANARVVWVDPEFLSRRRVLPMQDLPLWLPSEPSLFQIDAARARESGLNTRPVEDTARDLLEWSQQTRPPHRAGLHEVRERELLRAWQSQAGV